MRTVILLAAAILAFYCACVVFMFLYQRRLLYYPSHDDGPTPLEPWNIGERRIGFARTVPQPRAAWLMLHGNGGQASSRDYVLPRMSPHDALHVLEYPGYGRRDGEPTRASFEAAAREAWADLRARYAGLPLGIIGESLGSGPASWLAGGDVQPDKLVLLVPFDRLSDVAAELYPWLPIRWIVRDDWHNSAALVRYHGPVDIYAASEDDVIPHRHARRLADRLRRCRFVLLPGGHSSWADQPHVRIAFEPKAEIAGPAR